MINFVRSFNPVWYFVDLVGMQFDDTFWLYTLENEIPYIPAPVYHTNSGTPWTDPIQFLANGTLPVDIFWDPDVVYRLEIRQNDGTVPPSQADPLIYLIENYSPATTGSTPIITGGTFTENQASNGQFSIMNVAIPYTLTGATNPDPIEVAPGWFLDLVGTGNVTINRIPLNSTLSNPTNAPYALEINTSGGWTSRPVLRQRFSQNGMNWAEKHVSTSFTARIAGASQQITVRLDASDGAVLATLDNPFLTNDFVEYTGTAQLPAAANADLPPDAYIDYKVLLPTVADIYITSFQVVASDTAIAVEYEEDTIDRQVDHLFHYYKPQLEAKPIPSYLIGWDFPLNPAQLNGATVAASAIGANKSKYVWDQTIIFQSIDSGVGVTRATNGGITLTQAAVASGQTAIIQYLDQTEARKLLSGKMALAFNASSSVTGLAGGVSLWATDDATLPNVNPGTNNSIVLTLDADGFPATRNGTWTEILRSNWGDAVFELDNNETQFNFSGWDSSDEAISATATFFAVVIGFAEMDQNDTVTLNWVSLNAGDIATRPAPQSVDEVLNQCQRFYEKSYSAATLPGTITNVNMIAKAQGAYLEAGVAYHMVAQSFSLEYKIEKRSANVIVTLYNPATVTANQVLGTVFGTGSATAGTGNINIAGTWSPSSNTKSAFYNLTAYNATVTEGSFAGGGWASGAIRLHYVADARLGIVN